MPRFFFNVVDGDSDCRDHEGTLLPDAETACQEGFRFAAALHADKTIRHDLGQAWKLVVLNHEGSTLLDLDIKAGDMALNRSASPS